MQDQITNKVVFKVTAFIADHKDEEAERFWNGISPHFDDDEDIHKLLTTTFSAGMKAAIDILESILGKES